MPAAACACPDCGTPRRPIGEDVSEQLDYQPAALFVVQHVRPVYACPHCQGCVSTPPPPPQPIDRGLPGPGLLAHVAVSKYLDHLPLYRLERIFGRHGLELPRQTTCDWMAALAALMTPLYELLKGEVLASRVISTDDTPVPVLRAGRGSTKQGRLWVYLGDATHPATVFDYTPDRCRAGPAQFLGQYQGFLQADAYAGYDQLFATGRLVEVGCWAHAAAELFRAPGRQPAAGARGPGADQAALRRGERGPGPARPAGQSRAGPRGAGRGGTAVAAGEGAAVTDRPGSLAPGATAAAAAARSLAGGDRLLPEPVAGADALHGARLCGDRQQRHGAGMRGVAVGRKNWLFAGSDAGGRTAAILYSLMASCQRAGVEAFAWLRDVISRLSAGPLSTEALGPLLPSVWQPGT